MPVERYNSDGHLCLMFTDLSGHGGAAVQANQFLVVDGDAGAIIDPGGNVGFNELYLGLSRHLAPQRLTDIFASHADPDIIASLDRWMAATPAKVHTCRRYMVSGKILRIWARMVKDLPIATRVPQHGAPLTGPAIGEFIDSVQTLNCGADLMTERDYVLPGPLPGALPGARAG